MRSLPLGLLPGPGQCSDDRKDYHEKRRQDVHVLREERRYALTLGLVLIPVTGLAHGGLFTLGGAAFLILGLCLIIVPQVKGRKKAKQEEEHAG